MDSKNKQSLRKDPGALMALMGDKSVVNSVRQTVINEFHLYYMKYLYAVVNNAMKNYTYFSTEDIISVANNAFIKVVETADRFVLKPESDLKSAEQQLKAWIGKIARNAMWDYIRAADEVHQKTDYIDVYPYENAYHYPSESDFSEDNASDFIQPDSELIRLTKQYLSKVKPSSLDVAESYVQFADKHGNLPDYIRDGLCREYGFLRGQLRYHKRNVLDGLRKHLIKKIPSLQDEDDSDMDDSAA